MTPQKTSKHPETAPEVQKHHAANPFSAKFDVKKFTETDKFSDETLQMQLRVRQNVEKQLKKLERNKRMNKNLMKNSEIGYKKMTEKGIFSSHVAMKREFDRFKTKIDKKLTRIQKEKLRDHIRDFKKVELKYKKDGRERVVRYCERLNEKLLNLDSLEDKEEVFSSMV